MGALPTEEGDTLEGCHGSTHDCHDLTFCRVLHFRFSFLSCYILLPFRRAGAHRALGYKIFVLLLHLHFYLQAIVLLFPLPLIACSGSVSLPPSLSPFILTGVRSFGNLQR